MTKTIAAILEAETADRPYVKSQPLKLVDVDLDAPRAGELLIRIDAAGLCHSDLSVIDGNRPRPLPMVLGHEAAATVLETGGDDDEFSPGDKVVLTFLPTCGRCLPCATGESYLCEPGSRANGAGVMLQGGRRLSRAGQPVNHHLGVSAFAGHAVVDRRSAVKVPKDIAPEIAALFGCAVLTGVGAVVNSAQVRAGESMIVFGLGGIGTAVVLGGVAAGANPIVGVDPVDHKRDLAVELGAAQSVAPEGLEAAREANAPRGFDVAIETAGNVSALKQAYDSVRRGGRVVTVGLPNPKDELAITPVSLVGDGKTLIGSYMGSAIGRRDIPRLIGLWQAGRLPIDRLLTSVSPLGDINILMDRLADGEAVRQIVKPHMKGG
jgi:alcohol dehydrogenase